MTVTNPRSVMDCFTNLVLIDEYVMWNFYQCYWWGILTIPTYFVEWIVCCHIIKVYSCAWEINAVWLHVASQTRCFALSYCNCVALYLRFHTAFLVVVFSQCPIDSDHSRREGNQWKVALNIKHYFTGFELLTVGKPGKLYEAETRSQSITFLLMYTVDSLMWTLPVSPPFQEYIFRLEPGKVDSGKGKCPFDPKLNSVSALISKDLSHTWPLTCFYYSGLLYRALYSCNVAQLTQKWAH